MIYFLIVIPVSIYMFPSISVIKMDCDCYHRAEFTKDVVTPALGESGVGGAMAVYGAFDAIVSSLPFILVQFKYLAI
jgi:hypothetical protein